MKPKFRVILFAAAVLLQGCSTTSLSDSAVVPGANYLAVEKVAKFKIPDDLLSLKINALVALKHGTMDCGSDTAIEQDCPVSVMMVAPSGSTNCQATIVAAATVKVLKGTKRKLIWFLGQDASDTGRYEFHKQNGIFIAADDDNQIPNAGGWLNNNRSIFWRRDKNDKAGSEILYLPVVFRYDADGSRSLCDTIDPRIVNEGP